MAPSFEPFPIQKNRKETELKPKNTRQRTILAQIICHYVHLGLCSLDQTWRENIPGSVPFCNSSEGNSQADHSLSGCSKPIICEWKVQREVFYFFFKTMHSLGPEQAVGQHAPLWFFEWKDDWFPAFLNSVVQVVVFFNYCFFYVHYVYNWAF